MGSGREVVRCAPEEAEPVGGEGDDMWDPRVSEREVKRAAGLGFSGWAGFGGLVSAQLGWFSFFFCSFSFSFSLFCFEFSKLILIHF